MIAEFHWKGVNRFGQKQKGKCLAENREQLEKQLIHKGYSHLKISRNFVFGSAPKPEEITQTLNQIALLLGAAIPLKNALAMVLQNCQNIQLYQWLNQLIQQLESGFALSSALEKSGKFLPSQEIQLIKMGETSGQLTTIFCKIVEARTKSEKLHKKIKKILFYPVIVLFISLALSLGLLIFIVPQFAELYDSKEKSLPFITEILFLLSEFLTENSQAIVIFSLIMIIFSVWLNKKIPFFTQLRLAILSKLPVFNQIIMHSRIIFFCQHSALMLQAHIRLDRILHAFIQAKSDPVLSRESELILKLLQQGYRLNDGLNPTIFGNEVIQMIAIGEQSGNLAAMLNHISEIYQQRLDYQIDMLSQLLEPLLMVLMGIIVGTILIGLYLPIFDMGSIVG
ncbi:fimbrial protein [Pasteurellaceae bacterium Orientalotternb1]|nr:fimbrial protein [Pasteurellaceae bacterium Orientalotternb1]